MGSCHNILQEGNLVIRKAGTDDLSAAAQINYENWIQTYRGILPEKFLRELSAEKMEKDLSSFLLKAKKGILVCCQGKRLLGFATYEEDEEIEECRYLASLHVVSDARGLGIGTNLIKKVGNLAWKEEYRHLSICILVENQTAGKLYRKLGAEHYHYFQDNFHGVTTNSEKLWWRDLRMFAG